MNISRHIEYHSQRRPQKPALFFEGNLITYGDLEQLSNRVVRVLTELGVGCGDRVALYLPNHPVFITSYLGIQKLGAVAVSINTSLKPTEVSFILKDSQVKVLFTTTTLNPSAFTLPQECRLILTEELAEFAEERSFLAVDRNADDLAAILYTSGTTGFPKGAMLSQGNILTNVQTCVNTFGYTEDDRILLFLPMFHSFGQYAAMNSCFEAGATLILHREFELKTIVRSIAKHQVTTFFGVPTIYTLLLDQVSAAEMISIKRYISAAALLPLEVAHQWIQKFGVAISQGYGLTECSLVCFNRSQKVTPGSVGLPLAGIEVNVMDEQQREVGVGERGEVIVRGPNVMIGYWQRPDETARALRNGWFHTGDIGQRDAGGYLYIVDRLKDMINVGGEKVYPSEVERVLSQQPAIAAVAVYGVPENLLGEQVRASIVLRSGEPVTAAQIIAYGRQYLADFKVPSGIEFVEALPTGKTGKILKKVLREKFQASAAAPSPIRSSELITAETLKTWLTHWLSRELAVDAERIESNTPLLHYGMDSINAVVLSQDLSTFLGTEVPPILALKYPTIEQLTASLLTTLSTAVNTPDLAQIASPAEELSKSTSEDAWYPQLYNQQECYLWHEQVANKACLHICLPIRMGSPVDNQALQAALQTLIDRHEVLRTTYSRHGTQLRQRVLASLMVEFETIHVTSPSWEATSSAVLEAARRPFDLEQGPLLRGYLFSRAPDDHLFLIVTHHIAADATAFALLLNELWPLYETHQHGREINLPPVRTTFLDYVRWQLTRLSGPEGEQLWHYWQSQLAGEIPHLQLPTDYPRPPVASHYGASYFFQLDAPLTLQLRTLAREEGGTLYMLLLTAFQLLLHHYTKQDDILVATHTLNRPKPEFANLIGYLADTVAIRTRIPDQITFRELFGQVRTTVMAAVEHQGYPMKLLEQRLQLARDSLCSVWFTMLPQHLFQDVGVLLSQGEINSVELGGLHLESMDNIIPPWLGVWYELEMNLMEGPEVVFGTMTYSTDLFKEATMIQMVTDLQNLLKAIVANPGMNILKSSGGTTETLSVPCQETQCLQET